MRLEVEGAAAPRALVDEGLGELRAAFNKRQRTDRRRLVTLRATMVHRQEVDLSTFEEIHFLAHRMCGAAAIFECPSLAAAAQALIDEVTARRALKAGGKKDMPPFLTLDALIDLLFRMDDHTRQDNRKRRV